MSCIRWDRLDGTWLHDRRRSLVSKEVHTEGATRNTPVTSQEACAYRWWVR